MGRAKAKRDDEAVTVHDVQELFAKSSALDEAVAKLEDCVAIMDRMIAANQATLQRLSARDAVIAARQADSDRLLGLLGARAK